MALSFDGSSQYLQNVSGVPVAGYPFTMVCRFYTTNNTSNQVVMQLIDPGSSDRITLALRGDVGDIVTAGVTDQGVGSGSANSTGPFSINTWQTAVAVFGGTASRTIYLNGGNSATNTTSVTPTGLSNINIGVSNGGGGNWYTGLLADIAIYDLSWTVDDALSYEAGVSPLLIRPGGLVSYWKLIGRDSPEKDIVGEYPLTLHGSPPVGDHPRVFFPRGPYARRASVGVTVNVAALSAIISQPAQAAAGGVLIPTNALSLPVNQPAASSAGAATVLVDALGLPLSQPSPTAIGGALVQPDALSLLIDQPSPAIVTDQVLPAAAQAVTVNQPAQATTGGAVAELAEQGVVINPIAPSTGADSQVSADVQALSVSQPEVTQAGAAAVSPATMTVVLSQPANVVAGDAAISVAAQSVTVGLEPAIAAETTVISVGTISLTANPLAPAVSGGAEVPLGVRTISITPLVLFNGDVTSAPGCAELDELFAEAELDELFADAEMEELFANGEMDELFADGEMDELVAVGETSEFCCEDC